MSESFKLNETSETVNDTSGASVALYDEEMLRRTVVAYYAMPVEIDHVWESWKRWFVKDMKEMYFFISTML